MQWYYILVLLLAAPLLGEAQNRHFFTPCAEIGNYEPFWLNTTTQSTKIIGSKYIAYPNQPNGMPYLDTYQSIEWDAVAELMLVPSDSNPSNFKCPTRLLTLESAETLTLKAFRFSDQQCELVEGTRMLAEGVQEKFVDVIVTSPLDDNLRVTVTYSLANTSHAIFVPPSATTYYYPYYLNYTTKSPKINFKIENWNWTYTESVDSNLRIFFFGSTMSDEDTQLIYSEDSSFPFTKFVTNTSKTYFESSFVRGFKAQGVDYLTTDTSDPPTPYTISAYSPTTVPFAMSLCHDHQPPPVLYDLLEYDPSIIALYGEPDVPQETIPGVPPSPNKNRLNPAAYAVPVAAVTVGLAAAAVVIFFIQPQRAEAASKLALKGPSRDAATKVFANDQPPAPAPEPEPVQESAPKNNWARSERPANI